ncbi:hypothetical protein [Brevundimonas sp.]|uniref:hypothetical protein n=1 Tax=Brevundimonas sp. TaxID=1871086 RepID=UPI002BF21C1D|nr:hypothetical protein [Brevundimonas sp.]HWQ86175.1 hypothetical protein [Brevundimonas sp.]
MRMLATTSLALCCLVLTAGQTTARTPQTAPMTERTERLGLEGRRGPSLFRPGFGIGEYSGSATSRGSSTRLPWQSRDMARTEFSVSSPAMGEVTGDCGGGQSHTRILWITFDRETLSYDCVYGGAAPANARLSLALSRGSLLARLQQPQRAGELTWGGVTLKAETKRIGGLPFGGGRVMGYVFTRDGVEIGGIQLNGLRPTFYLPPQGSPDRDAAAVLAVSLFTFQDPANR